MAAEPNWLPAELWALKGWTRHADTYQGVVPGNWPDNLWAEGSEAEKGHKAHAECLGHVRDLQRWILDAWHPQRDDQALLLERHEEDLGLEKRATTAERIAWIVAFSRLGGTTTRAAVRAAFSECWSGDPASVALAYGDPADLPTNETLGAQTYATDQNTMLIYHASETTEPDYDLGDALIELLQPVGELWAINMDRYPAVGDDTCTCGRVLCGS